MDKYARTGAMPGALATGMRQLDRMLLGGLRPGKFYVLGGESGRGKTTLLLQWAFRIAPAVDMVGLVSPEMDQESMDERAFAQMSGFSIGEYKAAPLEGRGVWEATQVPQNVRVSFDPQDVMPFADEEKPSILIVDYAQQAVDYESERRHLALAKLGANCLAIAKQAWIPVVLGTQVNASAERDFSVRETRILEHQADALIYIDVQYEKVVDANGYRQIKPGSCLVIEKNRHGATGKVPIEWDREHYSFRELR
jgi:DNA repair protein RadA/Sms